MKQIIIYADRGVDGASLKQTVKSLQEETDPSYHSIKRKDAAALRSENWEEETSLLVVPGGRDIFYHAALDGKGTDKIRRFIENGGAYLGICAGAYFASHAIEFEKGSALEICADRQLKLFPGLAIGPALGNNKYDPESKKGAAAARILWQSSDCHTYYNGGCFFEAADQFSNVEVLARYADIPDAPAAVVACSFSKGRAVLTGVHLEYSFRYLENGDPYIEPLIAALKEGEAKRRELFRSLLTHLNIAIK